MLDGLSEIEGIEVRHARLESGFGLWGDESGIHDELIWGFGFVVLADDLGADTPFADQFHDGTEEVQELAPWLVEGIESQHQLRLIDLVVTDQLANVGEVLFFDMSLVVLAGGTAARQFDGRLMAAAVAVQVMIKKFQAAVDVDAPQSEGQRGLDVANLAKASKGRDKGKVTGSPAE